MKSKNELWIVINDGLKIHWRVFDFIKRKISDRFHKHTKTGHKKILVAGSSMSAVVKPGASLLRFLG